MLRNRSSISGLPTSNADPAFNSRSSFGSAGGASGSAGGYQQPSYSQQGGGSSGGSYGGYSGGNGMHSGSSYGGYAPQATAASDDKYASKRRSNSNGMLQMAPWIGCAVLGVWALTASMMNWSKASQLQRIYAEAGASRNAADVVEYIQAERRRAFAMKQEAKDSIRSHTDKHSSKVSLLQEQIKELQDHRDSLVEKHESEKAKARKKEKREIREWKEEAYYEQILLLESRVRKDSKRIILERFGPGPHKVAMYFRIPDGMGNLGPEQRMVIQMAPLDLVPHAVHFFLEQVEHGLWNSENYFYLNGPHVLQIGPQVWEEDYGGELSDEEYEEKRVGHFYELGLEELIFPDYSDSYPHVQYTLGFTGRPGGPDFYINKVDNQETHGPGGQDQHALDHQADSCFGMIVEGIEVMQMIFNAKTYKDEGWEWMIEEPIPITRAEILTKNPTPSARVLPAATGGVGVGGTVSSVDPTSALDQQATLIQQQQQQLQQEQQNQMHAQQQHRHPNHHQVHNAEQQFLQQMGGQQQQYQPPQQQQQQQQQQYQQNVHDGNHHAQGHHARMPLDQHGRVNP